MDKFNFLVIKSTGEREHFLVDKYMNSLYNIGLNVDEAKIVFAHVIPKLHNKISTRQLYEITFNEIKKLSLRHASIYSLKESLRLLGPSGLPFEHIVRQLFIQQKYTISHDQYIKGRCVTHEIDVVATLPPVDKSIKGKTTLVEVKFHVGFGLKSDIKIPLYVKARFDDIKSANIYDVDSYVIITNTKFTRNAITYSICAQLSLIAWNYPKEGGIETLINRYKLYPITVLHCLSSEEKQKFVHDKVILYQDLEVARDKNLIEKAALEKVYEEYKKLLS